MAIAWEKSAFPTTISFSCRYWSVILSQFFNSWPTFQKIAGWSVPRTAVRLFGSQGARQRSHDHRSGHRRPAVPQMVVPNSGSESRSVLHRCVQLHGRQYSVCLHCYSKLSGAFHWFFQIRLSVPLIDSNGCTLEPKIVPHVTYPADLEGGIAAEAFSFSNDPQISFNCGIRLLVKENALCTRLKCSASTKWFSSSFAII